MAQHRTAARWPFDRGGGKREAAARVLLRRDRRRRVENNRRRHHVAAGLGRLPQNIVTRRAGCFGIQSRRRVRRHGRDGASRQHHPGRWCLQIHRRRTHVDEKRFGRDPGNRADQNSSDRSESRVRRGLWKPLWAESGPRHLQVTGWRHDVDEGALPERQGRGLRSRIRSEEPRHSLCSALGSVPHAVLARRRRYRQAVSSSQWTAARRGRS